MTRIVGEKYEKSFADGKKKKTEAIQKGKKVAARRTDKNPDNRNNQGCGVCLQKVI